jgi:hypothetical protein
MKPEKLIEYLSSLLGEGLNISMEEISEERDSDIAKIKYGLFCLYEDLNFYKTRSDVLLNNLKSTLFGSSVIIITNAKGTIAEVNESFLNLSGYKREDLIGKTHSVLNSNYHSNDFFDNIKKTIKSDSIWHGDICNQKKDGTSFWISSYIYPIKDENGKIYQFWNVGTDINDKIVAENELLSKERALAESSRMASLGRFVGGVAHEINNPLAIIGSKASILKLKLEKKESNIEVLAPYIDDINKTVMRIASVIDSLTSLTDESLPPSKSRENIAKIVRSTMGICSERFRVNDIELITNIDPEMELFCNKLHISDILMNLVNNSFDAILSQENKWIQIDAVQENQKIKIIVTDSGLGIDKSIIGDIMHPYFTTKSIDQASGLGLSISKNIAQRYNGKLFLNSAANNTQFVLEIPDKKPAKEER